MKIEIDNEEIKILKDCLETDDMEDYSREQFEEGSWSKKKFNAFNSLRKKVGLDEVEPFEEQ